MTGDPLLDWVLDPGRWAPAPAALGATGCELGIAETAELPFTSWNWESCGTGCAHVSVRSGAFAYWSRPILSTEYVEGNAIPVLAYQSGARFGDRTYYVRRLVRVEDGALLGAVRLRQTGDVACSVDTLNAESALQITVASEFLEGGQWALASFSDGAGWAWRVPAVPAGLGMSFYQADLSSHGGAVFLETSQGVYAMFEPGSSTGTPIDPRTGLGAMAGLDGTAIWSLVGDSSSDILSWSNDTGVRTALQTLPGQTCSLSMSPTRFVGVSTSGSCHQWLSSPGLWAVDRPAGEGVAYSLIPMGDSTLGVQVLRTWGDHAAAIIGLGPEFDLGSRFLIVVVRLSDGTMRAIRPPDGSSLHLDALTLTDSYLYAGVRDLAQDERMIEELLRYDLSNFEQLGIAYPAVAGSHAH